MGWDVGEDGLKAVFSRDIPALVRREMRDAAVPRFWRVTAWRLAISTGSCAIPGGTKVVSALEEAFGLDGRHVAVEREVLRDYGNMSAATLLFVLERVAPRGTPRPHIADRDGARLHSRFSIAGSGMSALGIVLALVVLQRLGELAYAAA